MKVKDLISQEIDIDVYDDVCEELAIAFTGPMTLTDAGREKFAPVMEYDITLRCETSDSYPCVILHIDGPDNAWKGRLNKAKEFFFSAAGYCAASDYDLWFKEEV